MWSTVMYTDNNNVNADNDIDSENNDDNTAQLH